MPQCNITPMWNHIYFSKFIYMNFQSPTNIVIPNKSIVYWCFRYLCIVELKNYAHWHLIPCHLKSQIHPALHRLHNSLSVFWSKNIYCISRKKDMEVSSGIKIYSWIFSTIPATLLSLLLFQFRLSLFLSPPSRKSANPYHCVKGLNIRLNQVSPCFQIVPCFSYHF